MRKFIVEVGKDNVTMSEVCRILTAHLCTNVGVTEVSDFTFENWKKDVNGDCAENAQAQTCGNCKYDYDGCCRFEYIRHDSDYTCEKFEPTVAKNATVQKQIELVEE